MEKCTGKIADWLVKYDVIQETDRELYEYAIYSILLTLSPILQSVWLILVRLRMKTDY